MKGVTLKRKKVLEEGNKVYYYIIMLFVFLLLLVCCQEIKTNKTIENQHSSKQNELSIFDQNNLKLDSLVFLLEHEDKIYSYRYKIDFSTKEFFYKADITYKLPINGLLLLEIIELVNKIKESDYNRIYTPSKYKLKSKAKLFLFSEGYLIHSIEKYGLPDEDIYNANVKKLLDYLTRLEYKVKLLNP